MRARPQRIPTASVIAPQQTAFIRFELDRGDARRRRKALQEISRLYRAGARFNAENLEAIETIIDGLLLQSNQDKKVVRWSLNALAQLGRRQISGNPAMLALKHYDGDPEITAAGIAALSSMYAGRLEEIDLFRSSDPCLRTLAALQNTDPKYLDLSSIRIDIDKAHKEILKLALITIGLNKDIENLFHPKHGNGTIVRQLGAYPDDIVVQYSVWSIIENRRLDISDLGVKVHPIDALPTNVQSKVMQLIAMRESDYERRHALMLDGPYLPSVEAREGMARGLLTTYYDGLEAITIDWMGREVVDYVKALLAQHFARFSNSCLLYEDECLRLFDADPAIRDHLLLGAEGRPLYRELRKRSIEPDILDLFREDDHLMVAIKGAARPAMESVVLKVLVLASAPRNIARLRIDEEVRDLKEKIHLVQNKRRSLEVVSEWAVRVDQIQDALFNDRPNVLHFSGHGSPGQLVFEDRSGNGQVVDAKSFGDLIGLHAGTIECVVLNACFSEDVAKACRGHVSAVVGCDASIADDAAVAFSRAFYRALANGEGYDKAYRFARNEVALAGMSLEAEKYKLL